MVEPQRRGRTAVGQDGWSGGRDGGGMARACQGRRQPHPRPGVRRGAPAQAPPPGRPARPGMGERGGRRQGSPPAPLWAGLAPTGAERNKPSFSRRGGATRPRVGAALSPGPTPRTPHSLAFLGQHDNLDRFLRVGTGAGVAGGRGQGARRGAGAGSDGQPRGAWSGGAGGPPHHARPQGFCNSNPRVAGAGGKREDGGVRRSAPSPPPPHHPLAPR